jgi:exopolysaccharide biosynthesis polyprenyl glycosylphosphotransferase
MTKWAALELGAVFAAVDATATHERVFPGFGVPVHLLALALSLCWGLAFYSTDLYDVRAIGSFRRFASRLPLSLSLAAVMALAVAALLPSGWLSEGPVWVSLVLALAVVLPMRAAGYLFVRRQPLGERVLILGAGPLAERLMEEIARQPAPAYRVLGVVDDTAILDGDPASPARRLGATDDLSALLRYWRPDRIVVTLTSRRGRLPLLPLLEACVRGIAVEDGVDVYERITGKLAIETLTPSSLIFCKDFRKSRGQVAAARIVSVLGSALGLVLSAPLLALVSLAIVLDSPGPVFFFHERVGAFGARFRLIKFRTMHAATRRRSEWVRDNGDRITRVGKWLRKFRLDELPQFLNVLRGDMNLVGPRPHPLTNFELFSRKIPYYSLRSAVRPGITGWAQVRYGYANDLTEETEKMRYDLYYIKHTSVWFDIRILFETVRTVVLGRGASGVSRGEGPTTMRARSEVA